MTEKITTPETLDALPVASVVRSSDGQIWQRRGGGWDCLSENGEGGPYDAETVLYQALPPSATVLYRPDAPAPSADVREALAQIMAAAVDGCHEWSESSQDYRDEWLQGADAALAWFAARQPAPVDAETTTEWALRHDLAGVETEDDEGGMYTEETARADLKVYSSARLVSREVTPWTEVPRG